MGNAHTTANEAVLSFFVIFTLVYGLGAWAAMYAWFKVHRHWFQCGERPDKPASDGFDVTEDDGAKPSVYGNYRKTKGFPGTTAYLVTYVIIYFFQAYCAWRVWINQPAERYSYGTAYLWLAFFHVVFNALASFILFGWRDLTYATIAYVLSFALSGVSLVMLGLLTWSTTPVHLLPSCAVFVLQCIPTAGVLAVLVCVIILRARNRDRRHLRLNGETLVAVNSNSSGSFQ